MVIVGVTVVVIVGVLVVVIVEVLVVLIVGVLLVVIVGLPAVVIVGVLVLLAVKLGMTVLFVVLLDAVGLGLLVLVLALALVAADVACLCAEITCPAACNRTWMDINMLAFGKCIFICLLCASRAHMVQMGKYWDQ